MSWKMQAEIGENYDRVYRLKEIYDSVLEDASKSEMLTDEGYRQEGMRVIYFAFILPLIKTKSQDKAKYFEKLLKKLEQGIS